VAVQLVWLLDETCGEHRCEISQSLEKSLGRRSEREERIERVRAKGRTPRPEQIEMQLMQQS
jgi:hypothetical protein